MVDQHPPPSDPQPEFGSTREAVRSSGLSLSTLKRRQASGVDVGLRKSGRRLLVHLPTLRACLLAQRSSRRAD